MVTSEDIKQRWAEIQKDEEHILFVVGGPGSGKSKLIRELAEQDGWKYVEAKDLIEEEFLEVARELRPEMAKDEITKVLRAYNSEVVLIDGVNVLFAPILNLKPMELLRTISKVYPIVVGWRGSLDGNTLYLEHNGDPKYYAHEVVYKNHVIEV